MIGMGYFLAGAFTEPMQMTNNWSVFIWLIPLTIVISTVYKATKFDKVTSKSFIRESATLTVTILGFMFLIAAVLWILVQVLT